MTYSLPSEHESRIVIQGVEIALGFPDEFKFEWIGQRDVLEQLLAAWLIIDKNDIPLNPRLIGKPGVGKTTLAYAAAKKINRPVYIFQCTMDTRPEDLLISPVVDQGGGIRYVASALVTAMIRGGVCILDEANRMSEKSWASLAPLLDTRRYIESIVAGLKVSAHPDFRICVTMNDDASTFEIPEYIHSRLQPQIYLDFPEAEEERRILRENLPFVDEYIMEYVVNFLQRAHANHENYTIRDGINIARYAAKRIKSLNGNRGNVENLLREAILMTLGDEALMHVL
ncbi:AAA family ATPase [Candidatus Protochlamydia phocaeensis]|uniref:AAA family ATPase n=1 Tax=Candidatus Protochlamydia phocaeensis TaxID=1414722 RepID=UPI00083876B9|nr:AAA family ATPase [Candidatus Protochlamydia phocaeensis]